MIIAYYSHAGNVCRFVEQKLAARFEKSPTYWADGTRYRKPEIVRITSSGPHRDADSLPDLPPEEHIAIVFPLYSRSDHETGRLKDTVPKPMQDFIDRYESQILCAFVSGNRTFGKHYGYVDPDELRGIKVPLVFEMSGTDTDALDADLILYQRSALFKGFKDSEFFRGIS